MLSYLLTCVSSMVSRYVLHLVPGLTLQKVIFGQRQVFEHFLF